MPARSQRYAARAPAASGLQAAGAAGGLQAPGAAGAAPALPGFPILGSLLGPQQLELDAGVPAPPPATSWLGAAAGDGGCQHIARSWEELHELCMKQAAEQPHV